jgi:metal transporter CNNM
MSGIPVVVEYIFVVVLVSMSAFFSGLTLGLLGLDKIGLQIVMSGEDKKMADNARRIAPIRENGNLLLCTLLLGNVAVNSYLSILLSTLTTGTTGFLVSTFLILIFGEIIPQATCSRYALTVQQCIPLFVANLFDHDHFFSFTDWIDCCSSSASPDGHLLPHHLAAE